MPANTRALIQKIEALPPERIAEVEDFVDFVRLREQERTLTRAASVASVPAFAAIWNNPGTHDPDMPSFPLTGRLDQSPLLT